MKNEEYNIDPTISYDVIVLPSLGLTYPNKKKTVRVAHLDGYDENILTAPSLVNNNMVLDELLKRKILDKDLPFDEYVDEDKNAIMIFLRNTAFGTEYKLSLRDRVTDKKTGEVTTTNFDHIFDLSVVKVKDFTLTPNESGDFDYTFPISKTKVTFNFLTKQQENELEKIEKFWDGNGVPPVKTKEMEFMIKTINGEKDMMKIHGFAERMPIQDAKSFRKFVKDNKPGLDLTQTVKTPSGENIQVEIGFGVEFFRPFYGL